MKVLIVDDFEATRAYLRVLLEHEGHQVIEVGTAAAARDAFVHLKPDAALIDGNLPGHIGGGAVSPYGPLLVKEATDRGIRAILYSGDEDLIAEVRALGLPALCKGASIAEILAAVESCVGVREDRSAG